MQERSFFRGPPCLIGAPFWAASGLFVPRHETDSTFAGASLQWHETAITIVSDKESVSSYFARAKVMAVSMGRAAWRVKVLPVSKSPRHRVLSAKKFAPHLPFQPWCAKKFALQAQNGRKTLLFGALGELFRGSVSGRAALGGLFRGRIAAHPHCERVYVRPQSLWPSLISRGPISHAIPLKAFQVMNSNR